MQLNKDKIWGTGKRVWESFLSNLIFISLLYLYVTKKVYIFFRSFILTRKIWEILKLDKLIKFTEFLVKKVDIKKKQDDVSRMYLIELAFRNLQAKKTRTAITIGGLAVGVAAIVFLVSIGYGLERMVISRVARLEELKIVDVGLGEAQAVKMNDEVISKITAMEGVEDVIPVVSMVSKINFKNSVLDVMSFGVDERYLKAVDAKIIAGAKFEDKAKDYSYVGGADKVAGVSQSVVEAEKGGWVERGVWDFNIVEDKKVMLWKECDRESEMLGYSIRTEGGMVGEKIWGEQYYIGQELGRVGKDLKSGEEYSVWMRAKMPVWMVGEDGRTVPIMDNNGKQKWEMACVMLSSELVVDEESVVKYTYDNLNDYLYATISAVRGSVLGESTESAELASKESTGSAEEALVALSDPTSKEASESGDLYEAVTATDSSGIEWVELRKVGEVEEEKKDLAFMGEPIKEAFLSLGMLNLFGMSADKAIGETFKVSYIVPGTLVPGINGRVQSEEVEYKIVGVIDDVSSNYYYFQIADAKMLGVKNYSQIKILTGDQGKVAGVRTNVESLGLKTSSTLDTVAEIEKLFATLRTLLGLLGTVGLTVAGLGMFNTMTVSLLERTREVGVMKAMGMLSNEVKELFMAESMIMGVSGGFFGVLLGIILGQVLSLGLSSVSMFKGQGYMNISFVPVFFVVFIMSVSFVVGLLSGWYPSKRARQISALNALRYE